MSPEDAAPIRDTAALPAATIAARVRDRILISDPGLVRLDTAARTTIAVVLTTGILLRLVGTGSEAQILVLVGAISSWISAIPVNDVRLSDRKRTTVLIPLPAIGGLAIASVASGDAVREDAVFLAILFASVYIRRYGPRFIALGVVGVFAYFFGLFVGTRADQLASLAGVIVLGTAVTYLIRFVVVPKHPRGSLRWVIEAIRAQLRLVLTVLRAPPRSRTFDPSTFAFVNVARVNETMLAAQEQGVVAGTFDALIFRCEVAAENLIVATLDAKATPEDRAAARRRLAAEIAEVRAVPTSHASDPDASSPQRDAILHETARAATTIRYRLRPTTRQAIQVTAAAAVAMVIGEQVSSARWYWAVITAFIVFTGTTSAGETLTRALAGFAGTVLGVVTGTVIGFRLPHDLTAESALLFASMLFAAYFLRVGLGVAWFFVTLILVALYQLLGRYSEAILVVRVLEVLTGVVCGGLAALVIFPTSTRDVFRADVLAALQALRDGLAPIAEAGAVEGQTASRRIDAAVRRLRARVTPLRSGPTFAGVSRFARRWLRSLEACAYYARNAACAEHEPGDSPAVRDAQETLDRLVRALDADPAWPHPDSPVPDAAEPTYLAGGAAVFVTRIGELVARLRPA